MWSVQKLPLPGNQSVGFTATKDDRVGPRHARKFAVRTKAMGLPFYYYENATGGHAAGADLKQAARIPALTMTDMAEKLVDRAGGGRGTPPQRPAPRDRRGEAA